MPKFKVEIEEILQRVEEVEANNIEEAIDIIDEKYDNQEIVLDSEDFKGYEIREYSDSVRLQDLEENKIFNIEFGQAILLEGNDKIALIKKLNDKENPYIVAKGLTVSKYNTYFEWKEENCYQNLSEANERFEQLGGYCNEQNDLIYSEIGECTLGSHNIARFNNVDEIFNFLVDEDVNKEELIDMLSDRAKREVVFSHADVVIEEEGKFYYGDDLYFFEEEINKKTRIIDQILSELNIKGVKPYDVIELIEQNEVGSIDENLESNINKAIKEAGYEKTIKNFIDYINTELYKEDLEEEEENEM